MEHVKITENVYKYVMQLSYKIRFAVHLLHRSKYSKHLQGLYFNFPVIASRCNTPKLGHVSWGSSSNAQSSSFVYRLRILGRGTHPKVAWPFS